MKYGFGIDIGGTTVKVAFFDENGEMKCKWEIPTRSENGGQQILPDIAATVEAFLQQNRLTKESILGIGVGVPGPVSRDGVTLNCPLYKGDSPRLSEILELAEADTVLLGGKIDRAFTMKATKKQLSVIDYFECEELQIKNAVPTAEGAIAIALDELPITIFGCKAAVVGYGRVGKVTAKLLGVMGADVTVAARSGEQLAYAEVNGHTPLSLKKTPKSPEPLTALGKCDVIFNTVPYTVFTKEVLESLSPDTLIIDLAGDDGGVDRGAAQSLGIKTVWALSLPGKVAPFTAAGIICDCVLELLREKGVIKPK